jgi:hypothetical protein
MSIDFQHIPGKNITIEDRLCRRARSVYERKLPKWWFLEIQCRWGRRILDAFAAHHNRPFPKYWSRLPDSQAEAIHVFAQQWAEGGYVPTSTVEINSKSPTKSTYTEGERSDYGDSILDNSILVSVGDEDGNGEAPAITDPQTFTLVAWKLSPARKEAAGLPEETIKFLRRKLRERTAEIHNMGWRSYVIWACSNNPPTDTLNRRKLFPEESL